MIWRHYEGIRRYVNLTGAEAQALTGVSSVHSQFISKGASVPCKQRRVERLALEKSQMFKKIAAFGLSAALVLSPLAALAQTDTTAPAAPAAGAAPDTGAMAKPAHHPTKHMAKKKPAEPMTPAAPAEAPKS
jgi:hypothetical protein